MKNERDLQGGYVSSVTRLSRQEWDRVVSGFSDLTIYQTWAYGAVRWGEKNLLHFLLERRGEVVAAAQVRVVKAPVLRVGVAYVRYGPLWRRRAGEEDLEVFRQALRAMRGEFVRARGLVLRINLNLTTADEPTGYLQILKQEGYGQARFVPPHRTLLVDLAPVPDELRRNLLQRWRNQLNQAEKRFGVTLKSGTSYEYFRQFETVYRAMLAAKRFTVFTAVEEFMAMQELLPDEQKQLIVLGCINGRTVAGAVFSATGAKAILLLAASGEEGRATRASYAIQWHALSLLKARGCRWYDLGGIDPVTNSGGYHFKLGLAGKQGVDTFYVGQFGSSPDVFRAAAVAAPQALLAAYRRARMIVGCLRARRGFRRRLHLGQEVPHASPQPQRSITEAEV